MTATKIIWCDFITINEKQLEFEKAVLEEMLTKTEKPSG